MFPYVLIRPLIVTLPGDETDFDTLYCLSRYESRAGGSTDSINLYIYDIFGKRFMNKEIKMKSFIVEVASRSTRYW